MSVEGMDPLRLFDELNRIVEKRRDLVDQLRSLETEEQHILKTARLLLSGPSHHLSIGRDAIAINEGHDTDAILKRKRDDDHEGDGEDDSHRNKKGKGSPVAQPGGSASITLSSGAMTELPNAEDKDGQLRLAILVRMGLSEAEAMQPSMKAVLKTGTLAGQPVEYWIRNQPSGTRGYITASGVILCHCKECNGSKEISCSSFEEHAGSSMRRPSECIVLSNYRISIKDFCSLLTSPEIVDTYMRCQVCKKGGELMRCDKCSSAFHAHCLGLSPTNTDPPCPACIAKAAPGDRLAGRGRSTVPGSPSDLAPLSQLPLLSAQLLDGGAGRVQSGMMAQTPTLLAKPKLEGKTRSSDGGAIQRTEIKLIPPKKQDARKGHQSLFTLGDGKLSHGELVRYMAQGEVKLEGTVAIPPSGPCGILCFHCNTVVSASQFEVHAGYGSRRAPYDNIYTGKGTSLKRIAAGTDKMDDRDDDASEDGALEGAMLTPDTGATANGSTPMAMSAGTLMAAMTGHDVDVHSGAVAGDGGDGGRMAFGSMGPGVRDVLVGTGHVEGVEQGGQGGSEGSLQAMFGSLPDGSESGQMDVKQ